MAFNKKNQEQLIITDMLQQTNTNELSIHENCSPELIGKSYAQEFLSFLYKAEDKALAKTLEHYSDTFIEAIEYFGKNLKEAFEEELKDGFTE